MTRSRLRFSSLFAVFALAFSTIYNFGVGLVDTVLVTCRAVKNLVLDSLQLAVPGDKGKSAAVVAFVQAQAFVLRLLKRDRPVKSTAWSMCPST